MSPSKTIVVGMSGGVDSSVAALLLKQQGYRVIGLFMKNWEEGSKGEICPSAIDYEDVTKVCQKLEIPHYSVNFSKEYWDLVFSVSLKDFRAGHTPNPDILCNQEIKFKAFLKKALRLGADYVATGHYCRIKEVDSVPYLLKGLDPNKDQSYFLHAIPRESLKHVLFPIGEMIKTQVRKIAEENRLVTADKKDSTGICFIGKRNFKPFLQQYIERNPGNFETLEGKVVGQHEGLPFYTIGQRKGLDIGGPGEPWFIVEKDLSRNVIIVVQGETHEALRSSALEATDINWLADTEDGFDCTAKVRYRSAEVACHVEKRDKKVLVTFNEPIKAITPRQSIVFYKNDICLGGAIISKKVSTSINSTSLN